MCVLGVEGSENMRPPRIISGTALNLSVRTSNMASTDHNISIFNFCTVKDYGIHVT